MKAAQKSYAEIVRQQIIPNISAKKRNEMEMLKEELAKRGRDKVKPLRYQQKSPKLHVARSQTNRFKENEDLDSVNPIDDVYETSVHLK